MMYKICTIIGTRPEIIRLSLTIEKLDKHFNHTLIHTGQNYDYELSEIFFEDLTIRKPDYFLDVASDSLGDAIGNIIANSYRVLREIKPDALIVLGDTNSALSIIAAKRLKIPIFHIEAGNRCFDWNTPEEINRKIADHISDINLCYTENSLKYLLSEGFKKDYAFVVGSPMQEIITKKRSLIDNSKILTKLNLNPQDYIVLSIHREENVDDVVELMNTLRILDKYASSLGLSIIFSCHPRTRNRLIKSDLQALKSLQMMKPLGFLDYMKLQICSKLVISDSGTISEESMIADFRAVSVRQNTERPEAGEAGGIVFSGKTADQIINALDFALSCDRDYELPQGYQIRNTSSRILTLLISYIPHIKAYNRY